MGAQYLQLGGSLVAILALAGLALWLKLGGAPDLTDADFVRAEAEDVLGGFKVTELGQDAQGRAALVADGERIALLVAHGAHIAGWELGRTARATLHGHHLTVTTGERMVRPVTLDLGDNAQAWFTRFEALN